MQERKTVLLTMNEFACKNSNFFGEKKNLRINENILEHGQDSEGSMRKER